jgi:hypothetical protein
MKDVMLCCAIALVGLLAQYGMGAVPAIMMAV